MPFTITDPNTLSAEPRPGADVTPTSTANGTSYVLPTETRAGYVTGSTGADRATLYDLERDKDQVINLGAGDDLFVFGTNTTLKDLNGIVKMGDGPNDFDQVFLTHAITDYVFSLRSDGGIKIQYLGETDANGMAHGDAVTFYGAEQFTFRNITTDAAGQSVNYENTVISAADLYSRIEETGVLI
ncbi:hypothetical protein [Sphingomonas aracearum]|uniref:Uncharacterized protein n=1 Tax=Sphingomonas aracearum TaxID=2283317 RepID=A0A369VUI6_9SPHN|nr:hypothetical protein [Sphingomonas aracearum]RDE05315.1 hypothetical protein DVW87_08590 [Sphingomonas aracearum]